VTFGKEWRHAIGHWLALRLGIPGCCHSGSEAGVRGRILSGTCSYGPNPAVICSGDYQHRSGGTGCGDFRSLIAGVAGRSDSSPPNKANYYVFFRNSDGSWTSGANLGPAINDPANTVHSPYMSPDGKYFFFASNAPRELSKLSLKELSMARLTELNSSPQNGNSDILWIGAEAVLACAPRQSDEHASELMV
jgi:hypothetical protein